METKKVEKTLVQVAAEPLKEAKKICLDKGIKLHEYATEAIIEKNKKSNKSDK